MTATARRRSALAVECVVFASFGAPIGMLGAGWPEVRHAFDRSTGALGLVAALYGLGRLVTAPSGLAILRRWSIRSATTTLALVLAAACATVAVTRAYAVLVAAFTVVALASGCLDALGGRFQTVVRDVGSAGLMFGSYGVGATVGPVVVATAGWTAGFGAATALCVTGALLAAAPTVAWPDALRDLEPPRRRGGDGPLPWGVVALSLTLFGIYCGLEVTTGTWGASFLVGQRGVAPSTAAAAMSGFWAGMTVGRLGLGRVAGAGRRLDPGQLLVVSGVAAAVIFPALLVAPAPVAIVLLGLAGLALAGMFPTLMATTADRVGVAATGRVTGWQLTSANVTELGMSAAVGVAVTATGPLAVAVVLAAMAVGGLPLLVRGASHHRSDRREMGQAPPGPASHTTHDHAGGSAVRGGHPLDDPRGGPHPGR